MVKTGVPQGSTLGLLLFLVYINDLPQVTDLKVRLFADDACLSLEEKNPLALQEKVNSELFKVHQWLINNKLFINYTKSNYLIFNKNLSGHTFNIKLGPKIIDRANTVKYLGVTLEF